VQRLILSSSGVRSAPRKDSKKDGGEGGRRRGSAGKERMSKFDNRREREPGERPGKRRQCAPRESFFTPPVPVPASLSLSLSLSLSVSLSLSLSLSLCTCARVRPVFSRALLDVFRYYVDWTMYTYKESRRRISECTDFVRIIGPRLYFLR
jgi:hypothetical protein